MQRMIAYGDSNTFGYDPHAYLGGRYDADHRWVDLLEKKLCCEIVNRGLNGRMIPHTERDLDDAVETIRVNLPADRILVLLGTNDVWCMSQPDYAVVEERMDVFLARLCAEFPKEEILIAEPPMVPCGLYVDIARKHNVQRIDFSKWNLQIAFDGGHYEPEAHVTIAERLAEILTE